jgi:hypothetical protein
VPAVGIDQEGTELGYAKTKTIDIAFTFAVLTLRRPTRSLAVAPFPFKITAPDLEIFDSRSCLGKVLAN